MIGLSCRTFSYLLPRVKKQRKNFLYNLQVIRLTYIFHILINYVYFKADENHVRFHKLYLQDKIWCRLLIPSRVAGAIIGKGGATIKSLRDEVRKKSQNNLTKKLWGFLTATTVCKNIFFSWNYRCIREYEFYLGESLTVSKKLKLIWESKTGSKYTEVCVYKDNIDKICPKPTVFIMACPSKRTI